MGLALYLYYILLFCFCQHLIFVLAFFLFIKDNVVLTACVYGGQNGNSAHKTTGAQNEPSAVFAPSVGANTTFTSTKGILLSKAAYDIWCRASRSPSVGAKTTFTSTDNILSSTVAYGNRRGAYPVLVRLTPVNKLLCGLSATNALVGKVFLLEGNTS